MAGCSGIEPLSLRNCERSYLDDLMNRVKVLEAVQILEGKDYFGLSCIVSYEDIAVYHQGQGTRLHGQSSSTRVSLL